MWKHIFSEFWGTDYSCAPSEIPRLEYQYYFCTFDGKLEGISTKVYIQKHILCLKPHNL